MTHNVRNPTHILKMLPLETSYPTHHTPKIRYTKKILLGIVYQFITPRFHISFSGPRHLPHKLPPLPSVVAF